jgi:hypothetical protein
MDPKTGEGRHAGIAFALGNLVLVVWKYQVLATAVNVQGFSQVL